jgi:hypothetical protein
LIPYQEILEAVARGWGSEKNEHKIMDIDLTEAIAIEVYTSTSNHKPYNPANEKSL